MSNALWIALGGKSNLGDVQAQRRYDWSTFCQSFLGEWHTARLTRAEYATLTREQKARHKSARGWFVAGRFSPDDTGALRRSNATLHSRSALTADLDHLGAFGYSPDDVRDELMLLNVEFVLHSTPSSTPDDVRLRLIVPLATPITPAHYPPVVRWVAAQVGIDVFDASGFEPARLMYLPVRLQDGPCYHHHHEAPWLDPSEVLAQYLDPGDASEWPSSAAEGGARAPAAKAENPTTKRGVVGAFCRAFSIHDVVARWLSDHFTPVSDDTYLPVGSSGVAGARVYNDGLFLFNHHETGPTSRRNLNAFDLVRLCRYHDLDSAASDRGDGDDGPLPSYQAMRAFALTLPEVRTDLEFDPTDAEFDDVPDASEWEQLGASDAPDVLDVLDAPDTPAAPAAPATPAEQFQALRQDINSLGDGAGRFEQLRPILRRIATARLSPTLERTCLRSLAPKFQHKPTQKDLDKELRDLRRGITTALDDGGIRDLELEAIETFEREFFPNQTLKRVGKKYWGFREGLWSMRDDEVINGLFTDTIIRLRTEQPEDARELSALVGDSKTSALVGSLSRMLANQVAKRDADDDDPLKLVRRFEAPVINTRNCEIHFTLTGEHQAVDHNPAHFFTCRADTEYDPNATCPAFNAFLEHAFANAEDPAGMIEFAHELGGYLLNQARWLKLWVMCVGDTNTGKTTFAEVITALLGGAAAEKKLTTLSPLRSGEFNDAALIGKLMFVDDDLDKGAMLPDGDLKRISEEKIIQTPVKYGDDIRFTCRAVPVICTNHWPRTRDVTDAFTQRTLVVPFNNPYIIGGDADDHVKHHMLTHERSGILNRFIEGLSRLRKRGHFSLPVDVLDARRQWLQHANPVLGFVGACLVREQDALIRTALVHETYVQWHADEYGGTGVKPLNKAEFWRRCDAALGGRSHYTIDGDHAYHGWRLADVLPMEHGTEFSATDGMATDWENSY